MSTSPLPEPLETVSAIQAGQLFRWQPEGLTLHWRLDAGFPEMPMIRARLREVEAHTREDSLEVYQLSLTFTCAVAAFQEISRWGWFGLRQDMERRLGQRLDGKQPVMLKVQLRPQWLAGLAPRQLEAGRPGEGLRQQLSSLLEPDRTGALHCPPAWEWEWMRQGQEEGALSISRWQLEGQTELARPSTRPEVESAPPPPLAEGAGAVTLYRTTAPVRFVTQGHPWVEATLTQVRLGDGPAGPQLEVRLSCPWVEYQAISLHGLFGMSLASRTPNLRGQFDQEPSLEVTLRLEAGPLQSLLEGGSSPENVVQDLARMLADPELGQPLQQASAWTYVSVTQPVAGQAFALGFGNRRWAGQGPESRPETSS